MGRLRHALSVIFLSTAVFLQGCGNDTCSGRRNVFFDNAKAQNIFKLRDFTEARCQRKCIHDPKCKFWRWYDPASKTNSKECHIFESKTGEVPQSGVTSGGPCKADNEQFLPNLPPEDASPSAFDAQKTKSKPLCNDTLANKDHVQFNQNEPIASRDQCVSLADKLDIPFAEGSASVHYNTTSNVTKRCYLNNNLIYYDHTNNTASVFCEEVSRPLCSSIENKCSGPVRVRNSEQAGTSISGLRYTPLVQANSSDADETMLHTFARRTCKTDTCESDIDLNWCCDVKRGRADDENRNMTDNEWGIMLKGYHLKSSESSKTSVFRHRKNGAFLIGYNTEKIGHCENVSREYESFSELNNREDSSSQSQSSFSHQESVSANYLIFSVKAHHSQSETRDTESQKYIEDAISSNLRVVEKGTKCVSKKLSNLLSIRPLFSTTFLGRLREIENSMKYGDESKQKEIFTATIQEYGTHVISTGTFGSKDWALSTKTKTSESHNSGQSSSDSSTTNQSAGIKVRVDAKKGSGEGGAGFEKGTSEHTTSSQSTSSTDTVDASQRKSGFIGKCTCNNDQNYAGSNVFLISAETESLLSLIREDWLTPSAWFEIYAKYDVPIIREFFLRWFALAYNQNTCFIADARRFELEASQASRKKCYANANSMSCNLHMCVAQGRGTNKGHINTRCPNNECTEDFCCA